MPSEFAVTPTILVYWTNVGFLPAEGRAYGRGFMSYYATNAEQNVALSLRFENREVASTNAFGENSDWLPANRMLFTTAYLGVSGACGHLADGGDREKLGRIGPGIDLGHFDPIHQVLFVCDNQDFAAVGLGPVVVELHRVGEAHSGQARGGLSRARGSA